MDTEGGSLGQIIHGFLSFQRIQTQISFPSESLQKEGICSQNIFKMTKKEITQGKHHPSISALIV